MCAGDRRDPATHDLRQRPAAVVGGSNGLCDLRHRCHPRSWSQPRASIGDPTTSIRSASVVINPDPTNSATKGPDGNPLGPESHTPDAENPDAENPDAENPDAENPDAENPDAENPDAENPDAEIPTPRTRMPRTRTPRIPTPRIPTRRTRTLRTSRTCLRTSPTTAHNVRLSGPGPDIVAAWGGLFVPADGTACLFHADSINCNLVRERRNQTLFSIPLTAADLAPQDFFAENDPSEKHPTILVRPGESIRVTLRIVRDTRATTQPFCSPDATSPDYCFNKIVIRTQAQAPNSGETEPDEDSVGSLPGPDLLVEGTVAIRNGELYRKKH